MRKGFSKKKVKSFRVKKILILSARETPHLKSLFYAVRKHSHIRRMMEDVYPEKERSTL